MSLAPSVSACCSISRSRYARTWSVDMPASRSGAHSGPSSDQPGRLAWSTRCSRCCCAREFQAVVAIDVPNAPAEMRTKLFNPAASGNCAGEICDSVIALIVMKNSAPATPCSSIGRMIAM